MAEGDSVPADKLRKNEIEKMKGLLEKGETIETLKEGVSGLPAGKSDLFKEPDGTISVRPKRGPGARRPGEPTGFTQEDL